MELEHPENVLPLASRCTASEAIPLELLRSQTFDLVLVNRKLDIDDSDGLEIIERIKADPQLAGTPCMLITNYAEHQQAAVAAGALAGFGKKELHAAATRQKLAQVLTPATSAAS